MKTIGMIGTGIMGKPMAANLLRAGFSVHLFARHRERVQELETQGAVLFDCIADCVRGCAAVITVLGFPSDVEEVYFGSGGILDTAAPGTYVIDMTTSSPGLARKIYCEAEKKKLYALDAPVTGGEKGAADGTLSIMVGGDLCAFDACADLFSALGRRMVFMGAPGSGQQTKLSNQMMIAGAVAGVCEGMSYAMGCGLDMEKWFEIVSHGGAASRQLENLFPNIQEKNDLPGFQIRHFVKDMKLAQAEGSNMGMCFPILEQVLKSYERMSEQGYAGKGTQTLIHQYLDQTEKKPVSRRKPDQVSQADPSADGKSR